MNELIETIFTGFTVDQVEIPVVFLHYEGHGEPYVVYGQQDANGELSGDDELLGYIDYYDFDVYSKGNYFNIIKAIREKLEAVGFVFQPSRCSGDMFETDTGYYHKTLNFAIPKEEK
jgi:hypothetical protein